MGRLEIVLLFAAIAVIAQTASGQSQAISSEQTTGPSQAAAYVVIGDVQNCDYYPLHPSTATTIREAVSAAGLLNDSSNVAVLRGTQEQAVWTQIISSGVADSGEKVLAGDVLVVQSLQPVKAERRQNAALRTDAGVIIVALADESIAVGDVLQQTGNLAAASQNVRISFRFQGRTPTVNAALTDRVFHGDVISISQTSRRTLKGFGKMSPAFSEWAAPGTAAPLVSDNAKSQVPLTPMSLPSQTQLQMPNLFDQNLAQPAEPVDPAEEANGSPQGDSLSADSSSGFSVQPISQAAPSSAVEAADMAAPAPPVEIPIADVSSLEQQASGPGFWNLVFVGVLLVAGILILAGSLKPDDEHTTEHTGSAEQSRAAVPPLTLFNGPSSPPEEISIPAGAEQVAKKLSIGSRHFAASGTTVSIAETHTLPAPTPKTALVAAHEWFGDEWRNQASVGMTASAPLMELPVMPAICKPEKAEDFSTTQHSLAGSGDSIAEAATITPPPRSVSAQSSGSIDQRHAVSVESKAPFQSEVTNVLPAAEQIDGLDELLQNRLPVDLCAAQLPLRVSLFGKAAGPRRLRVDAAHTRVPAPHINVGAERKREEPAMATISDRIAERTTIAETGSLDRALHNLQDRIDS
jgi:hypothetical protein